MLLSTKQRLCLFVLSFVFATSPSLAHLHAREEVVTYKEVKSEYLKTFAQEKPEPELSSNLEEQKPKELKLVIEELTDYDQHNLVATMFLQHGRLQKHEGIIDSTFIRKMELICGGENTQQHLLAKLVPNSMSVFGHIGLASLLINPTADISELCKRQNIIQGLQALFESTHGQTLENSFETIKTAQTETLRYWQPEPEMNQELFKRVYFGKGLTSLNQSTAALELGTRLGQFFAGIGITSPVVMPLLGLTINNTIGIIQEHNWKVKKKHNWNSATISWDKEGMPLKQAVWQGIQKIPSQIAWLNPYKKAFKDHTLQEKIQIEQNTYNKQFSLWKDEDIKAWEEEYKQVQNPYKTETLGDFLHKLDYDCQRNGSNPTLIKGGYGLYIGFLIASSVYNAKKTYDHAHLNKTIINHIQENLIAVATSIREAKNIYTLLKSHEATAHMQAVEQLANFFEKNGKRSAKLSDLLGKLETNTFKGKASFFSLTGRVLATHKLMQEIKDELIPLFESVGNIEAYVAAAKLYNKHLNLPVKFCFAEFINAAKPSVALGNFWNPFIDPTVVVANDAVFNSFEYLTSHTEVYQINAQPTARNVILTGPNTAGKSTVIKATALNILLGQTFGICSADRAVFTPFSIINCHLNITDDIATGSSLFQAEVTRAKELLTDVQSLPRNKFCFTLMDELFNGTNAEGGSKAAYKFADQLGNNYDNLILVIATHFPILTELENTNNFRNMHVGAYLDDAGKLVRPFKLQEGVFQDPDNKILQAILEREGIFEQA